MQVNSLMERAKAWVQQISSPKGTAASRHRQVKSTGVTTNLRTSAAGLQLVWWRWRHCFLEAQRLDLELRRQQES